MIDQYWQYTGKSLVPTGEIVIDEMDTEFKRNQIIRVKATKTNNDFEPSLEQSNTLHACIKLVADQADNDTPATMRTPKSVKMSLKIGIDFRDPTLCFVRPDGQVQFAYRSFKFTGKGSLRGLEREKVMQQAFEWLADYMGLTVEEMIAEAKSRMLRRNP